MSIKRRILRCLPFLGASYLLIQVRVKEEGCWGPIESFYTLLLLVAVIITGSIAILAAFRKSKADELSFEPVTLSIILIVSSAIVFSKVASEKIRGDAILIAQVANTDFSFAKHNLQLRSSGKYLLELQEVEWACTYGGSFTLTGDTLILNDATAAETDSNFVEKYLVDGDRLIPLGTHVQFLDTTRRPWHLQILKRP
jgi:hypothetical protein